MIQTNFNQSNGSPLSETEGGYTLVEMIIVLIVLAALAGVAVVRFSGTQDSPIQSAAHRIISDMAYAQETARYTNAGTEVNFFQTGGGGGGGGGCFVATACYGADSPQVQALRGLRDKVLLHYSPGRAFVRWYYRCGPELARQVLRSPLLQTIARAVILPVALLSMPLADDAQAFGGGGGGGAPSGTPNTYEVVYQNGDPIPNPQGGGDYIVPLGTQVELTSSNRSVLFDSEGSTDIADFGWGGASTAVVATLNGQVSIRMARWTGVAWVE